MIIGFDTKRLFLNESGLGSYSRTQIRWLLTFFPKMEFHLYSPKTANEGRLKHFSQHLSINIHQGWSYLSWFWRSFLIPFFLRGHHVQVYHGLSGELPFTLFSKRIKKVVTIHDVIFKSRPQDYSWSSRFIYDIKTRWALRIADRVICISYHTKSQILKYYRPNADKLQVIYPTIHPDYVEYDSHLKASEFKSLYNIKQPYFLYVGNVRGRKNLNIIIEALKLMTEEKRKKLIIVTNDKYEHILSRYSDDNIIDWIRVETGISNRILAGYYQYAAAVICPSLQEGLGLPVIEALQHGAITICSNTEAHREAGGDAVYYFEPTDSERLSELMSNLSYRERKTKEQTLSHLKKFDPRAITEQLMDVYRQD